MSSVPLPVPWCLWSFWDRVWGFPATCASLQNDSAQNHIRILIFSFTYIYHAEALPIPLKKISWTGFLFFTPAVLPAPHARQWPVRFWWTRCPHMIRSLSNNPYLQVKEPWRSIVYLHWSSVTDDDKWSSSLWNDNDQHRESLYTSLCSSTRAPAIREYIVQFTLLIHPHTGNAGGIKMSLLIHRMAGAPVYQVLRGMSRPISW